MNRRCRRSMALLTAALAAASISACSDDTAPRAEDASTETPATSSGPTTPSTVAVRTSTSDVTVATTAAPAVSVAPGDRPDVPEGLADQLRASLSSRGLAVSGIDVSDFARRVTVEVTDASKADVVCEAASAEVFGGTVAAGAIELVSVEKGPGNEPTILAQRSEGDPACRRDNFTYRFITHYLTAEHGAAPWIGLVSGSGSTGSAGSVEASVSLAPSATADDALAVCQAAAPYVFGPRFGSAATKLEIRADGDSQTVLASATSAAKCRR